jgi:hypothetical protein
VWFVAATAPVGGTGAIGRAFQTVAAAIAAAAADDTVVVAPGDYTGEANIDPAAKALNIVGWGRAGKVSPASVMLPTIEPAAPGSFTVENCSVTIDLTAGMNCELTDCATVSIGSGNFTTKGGTFQGEVTTLDANGTTIDGNLLGNTFRFLSCLYAPAIDIDGLTLSWDDSSNRAAAAAGCRLVGFTSVDDLGVANPLFGFGTDGNLTIAAGTTAIAIGAQFANVTISGTGIINMCPSDLYVSGILDISNATNAGQVTNTTGTAQNGGNAAADVGGAAGGAIAGEIHGAMGRVVGTAGASGGTGAGATGAAVTTQDQGSGGNSGGTNAAGAGKGGAGGVGGAGGTLSSKQTRAQTPFSPASGTSSVTAGAVSSLFGGASGRGGSSGGGDGAAGKGGGGGGGAAGGEVGRVRARYIKVSDSTAAACFQMKAGNGGNAGQGTNGDCGGGSGGAASGGGAWDFTFEWVIFATAADSNPANIISAPGGTGGNGATGNVNGAGAPGGEGGTIVQHNIAKKTRTTTTGAAGAAAVGTAGGAGGACQAALAA